jgi:hypothetical protein
MDTSLLLWCSVKEKRDIARAPTGKEARASVEDRRKSRLAPGEARRAETAKNGVPKQNDGAAPERPDTAGAVPGDLI